MHDKLINFKQLFETVPGLYLILSPDLEIIAVNDAYNRATMTKREEIVGHGLFEIFPDNPNDVSADGVSNLLKSLNYVRKHKKAHTMAVQKYDIRRPDGTFEERYWSPVNSPMLNENNEISCIIHRVEDVTELVSMKKEHKKKEKFTKGLELKIIEMEYEIIARSKEIQKINEELEQKVLERTQKVIKNERRFRSLIENNYDAITLSDENNRPLYQSPSTDRIIGWTLEDRKRLLSFSIVHPEDSEKVMEIYRQAIATPRKSFYSSHRLKHKEGHYIWSEGFIMNLLDDPGINAVVSNFREITERKKNEERIIQMNQELEVKINERTKELEDKIQQLRENEDKFQKAFHVSAAGMSITKLADSTYLDVNNAFAKMTGFSREEILGKTSAELGLIINFEKREEVLKEVKEKGAVKNFEMTVQNKFGEVIEIMSSIETVILNDEKHAINIIYDITQRKKNEEQLAIVNKELEAFSYSVSHDLRAPLRAINGYAEMLAEDYGLSLDDEGKRILNNIKYYAEKMGTLIDDLLAFSRLGRKELQKRKIDMTELMEGVMIDIGKSTEHHAQIKIKKLHPVNADYGLIQQVMFNLVSNAIKYSSKKEKPVIEISSLEKNKEIIFTVKDNGAGFNMLYSNKLFGVFQRLHSQEEFHGTGVGLAIVQRIISKHNGKIWAEGIVDEGATFHFSLNK